MKAGDRYHVIYLTGPPAVGKSTLVDALRERLAPLEVFIYSERLLEFIKTTRDLPPDIQQDDLRRLSSSLIGSQDVEAVDDELLMLVDSSTLSDRLLVMGTAFDEDAIWA